MTASSEKSLEALVSEAVQINKAAIIAKMREFGLISVGISYEGFGDQGEEPQIDYLYAGNMQAASREVQRNALASNVEFTSVEFVEQKGRSVEALKTAEVSLRKALKCFAHLMIEHKGLADFEIGYGGGGEICLFDDGADGCVQLDHYANVSDDDDPEREYEMHRM